MSTISTNTTEITEITNTTEITEITNTTEITEITKIGIEKITETFIKLVQKIEKEKNIIIKYWYSEWGFIEFYSRPNILIWKIWNTSYELDEWNIVDNHLWIEVYWINKWKWLSVLLYDLYYKFSLENDEIIYPNYDFVESNSRIKLLLKRWYKLKEKFINWIFIEISDNEIKRVLDDVEKKYYWRQKYIYKMIL